MTHDQLPAHWREWVEARAAQAGGAHHRLSAGDFPTTSVRLTFEDGSRATFRHAFSIEDCQRGELALFTEHCGYHVFRASAVSEVSTVDSTDEQTAPTTGAR
jgi:hypothetical protein